MLKFSSWLAECLRNINVALSGFLSQSHLFAWKSHKITAENRVQDYKKLYFRLKMFLRPGGSVVRSDGIFPKEKERIHINKMIEHLMMRRISVL